MNLSKQTKDLYVSSLQALNRKDKPDSVVLDRLGNQKLMTETLQDYFETLSGSQTKDQLARTVQNYLVSIEGFPIASAEQNAMRDMLYSFVQKHHLDMSKVKPNPSVAAKGHFDTLDFPNKPQPWVVADHSKAVEAAAKATSLLTGKKNKVEATDANTAGAELLNESGFFSNLFHAHKQTNVFHHSSLGLFAGVVNGRSLGAAKTEKQLFTHLNKSGHTPQQATDMIERIKSGNPSGKGQTTAEHHLQHALRHTEMAKTNHDNGDIQQRDEHLKKAGEHLDRATLLAGNAMKNDPASHSGMSHPSHNVAKHFGAIRAIMKTIPTGQ